MHFFKTWTALIILIFALAAVKIPGLYNRGLENDEAITMLVVAGQSSPQFPTIPMTVHDAHTQIFSSIPTFSELSHQLKVKDVHPPLYFAALAGWAAVFDFHFTTLRYFSVLFFAIGTLFFSLILRRSGLGAWVLPLTAFYGLSAATTFYAYDIRQYMFSQALVNIAVYFLLMAKDAKGKIQLAWIFSSGIAWGLGFYSSYLVVFAAMAGGIYVLLLEASSLKDRVVRGSVFTVPFVLATAAVWPFYVAQKNSRPDQDHGYLGFFSDVINYGKLLRESVFRVWFDYLNIPLGIILLSLLVFGIFRTLKDPRRKEFLFAILLVLLPLLGLMLMNIKMDKHIYRYQSIYLCSTGLIWLLAYSLLHVRDRFRWVAGPLMTVFILIQLSSLNWGTPRAPVDFRAGPYRELIQETLKSSPGKTLYLVERGDSRDLPTATLIYLYEDVPHDNSDKDIVYWYPKKSAIPQIEWAKYEHVFFITAKWNDDFISESVLSFAKTQGFQLVDHSSDPLKKDFQRFYLTFKN